MLGYTQKNNVVIKNRFFYTTNYPQFSKTLTKI